MTPPKREKGYDGKRRMENAGEIFRRALEAQDAEENWTDEERRAMSAHIEEGYLQAERGELIDSAQARREIQAMKNDWRPEEVTTAT